MNEVSDGSYGVEEQHPRACISHHDAHPFLHLRLVAMDGTILAGGFLFAERAAAQAGVSVFQQLPAGGAQLPVTFLVPAIDADHLFHGMLLLFNHFHRSGLFLYAMGTKIGLFFLIFASS